MNEKTHKFPLGLCAGVQRNTKLILYTAPEKMNKECNNQPFSHHFGWCRSKTEFFVDVNPWWSQQIQRENWWNDERETNFCFSATSAITPILWARLYFRRWLGLHKTRTMRDILVSEKNCYVAQRKAISLRRCAWCWECSRSLRSRGLFFLFFFFVPLRCIENKGNDLFFDSAAGPAAAAAAAILHRSKKLLLLLRRNPFERQTANENAVMYMLMSFGRIKRRIKWETSAHLLWHPGSHQQRIYIYIYV